MAAAVTDTTPADHMSADVLRRAAASMRERAEAAAGEFGIYPDSWWGGMGTKWRGSSGEWMPVGGMSEADARHVASWHPAVALAVADWLDSVADAARAEINGADIHHALTVAHAYLGETP